MTHISQAAIPLPPQLGDRRTTRGLAVDAAGTLYVAVDRLVAPEVAVRRLRPARTEVKPRVSRAAS